MTKKKKEKKKKKIEKNDGEKKNGRVMMKTKRVSVILFDCETEVYCRGERVRRMPSKSSSGKSIVSENEERAPTER